jgi:hypothetical protein
MEVCQRKYDQACRRWNTSCFGYVNRFAADTLSVTANNACGSSVVQIKATDFKNRKNQAAVSGPATVMPMQTGLVYSIVLLQASTIRGL